MQPQGSRMRSDPLQTRLSQAGGGPRGYVKWIERGKVGLGLRIEGYAVLR